MMQNLTRRSPDFSDENVCCLCTDAITDFQFRESNAKSSLLERNGMKSDLLRGFTLYMYLFHGHFVLWELESARTTIENLSRQNNKKVYVEVCIFITV